MMVQALIYKKKNNYILHRKHTAPTLQKFIIEFYDTLHQLLVCREIFAIYFRQQIKIFCWENEWNFEVKWHNT
jgi:hypothetical protein